jgi:hypothetical protein
MKLSKKSGLKFRARARFARNCFKGKFQTKTRFLATVCLPSGRPRFWNHTTLDSLSQQRSAGRGLGRGDFELKTSSPRPSPPASLGGEGVRRPLQICEIQSIGGLLTHSEHTHNRQSPIGN